MRDNYVAKNANKFNRGGFHTSDKYQRGEKGVQKYEALEDYHNDPIISPYDDAWQSEDDMCEHIETEEQANWRKYQETLACEVRETTFDEPYHPEDFD